MSERFIDWALLSLMLMGLFGLMLYGILSEVFGGCS